MRLQGLCKTSAVTLLFLPLLFLFSCEEDEIKKLSFTEADIVDLVKYNFLAEYGGLERERLEINALAKKLTDKCDLEKVPYALTVSGTPEYTLAVDGNYSIQCRDSERFDFPWSFYFYNKDLTGQLANKDVKFDFNGYSDFTISYNQKKMNYFYVGSTTRIIKNLRQYGEDQPVSASLKMNTGMFQFDFEESRLTPVNIYRFTFELTNIHSYRDKQNFAGTIALQNARWTLTFEEGASYSLES